MGSSVVSLQVLDAGKSVSLDPVLLLGDVAGDPYLVMHW